MIFAETGLKADDLTCAQNSKTWLREAEVLLTLRRVDSQSSWELDPDLIIHGNHPWRCMVCSRLCDLSLWPNRGEAENHTWAMPQAPWKQNTHWGFPEVRSQDKTAWRSVR